MVFLFIYFYSQEKGKKRRVGGRLNFCTRQWSRLSRTTDTEHCLFEDLWAGAVRENWQAQHTALSFQRFLTLKHLFFFTVQLWKIKAKYENVETAGFSQLLLAAIALERYNQALHYMGLQNWYLWKLEVRLHGKHQIHFAQIHGFCFSGMQTSSQILPCTLMLHNGPEDRHHEVLIRTEFGFGSWDDFHSLSWKCL